MGGGKIARETAVVIPNDVGIVSGFLDDAGEILVNEVAPRAHNSGHHTIEANATSQFAQLLRVTLDLPLGSVAPVRDAAAMVNVLGEADAPKGTAGLDAVFLGAGERCDRVSALPPDGADDDELRS